MNVEQTINVYAGGPGSGCHGDKCGRPRIHQIEEKDIVKLKKADSLWNTKTGNVDKFPPGLKAVVINVLPKVGSQDQLVKVTIQPPTKKHEADAMRYLKMEDVELHTPGVGNRTPKSATFPVQSNQVIMKTVTSDGAKLTWVKPQNEPEKELQTLKDISKEASYYKGKFGLVDKVAGADGQTTRIYDTTKNIPSSVLQREGGSAISKAGVTVWVHRYSDKVVIQEQQYARYSQKTRGIMSFEYKNIGSAFGMLKNRYGISIPLKGQRF